MQPVFSSYRATSISAGADGVLAPVSVHARHSAPPQCTCLYTVGQPEGLVWFLLEGVVIQYTGPLRGAVYQTVI